MKMSFVYSKIENLFFFISNLTEWHFSSRKNYNQDWIEKSGPLTKKEKESLLKFKKIMKKYGFVYKNNKFMYLGQFFFLGKKENEIWKLIEKFVNKSEFKDIKDAFINLNSRFEKVYDEKKLFLWKKAIEKTKNEILFNELINRIKLFLKCKKELNNIKVHLLFSPAKDWLPAGGANIGNKDITLEVPIHKRTKINIEAAFALIAHEIGHLFLDNSNLKFTINDIIKKNKNINVKNTIPSRPLNEYIQELIINLCAPSGYFCQKYLTNFNPIYNLLNSAEKSEKEYNKYKKRKIANFSSIKSYIILQLYPLIKQYYKKKKNIDKNLLSLIINFLENK